MKPEVESLAAMKKEVAESAVTYMTEAMTALGEPPNEDDIDEMSKGSVPLRRIQSIKRILGNPDTPAFIREHFNVVLREVPKDKPSWR